MSAMPTNIKAFRYVSYRDIPRYLDMGWLVTEPKIFDRLSHYGVTMIWTCDCALPDMKRAAA